MKIGVYCGSFNPIHNGHINVAKWILEKEKLDKIIWVPLYKPFHKSLEELEAPEYRLEMVKLAVKDNKQFEVFDKEIVSKEVRDTLDIIEDINRLSSKDIIILFKPQFEVGTKIKRKKKRVVKDKNAIINSREKFLDYTQNLKWKLNYSSMSKLQGKDGNEEEFFYFSK